VEAQGKRVACKAKLPLIELGGGRRLTLKK
jgi:hypothetical protein